MRHQVAARGADVCFFVMLPINLFYESRGRATLAVKLCPCELGGTWRSYLSCVWLAIDDVPKTGREPSCLWWSFSVPFVLKFPLISWLVLAIACVCLFWLLHLLLHSI